MHFMNPFGCMGLQDGNNTAKNWGCIKRLLYRLGIVLAFIIALPFAAVFGFPIFFCVMMADSPCYKGAFIGSNCCCKFFYFAFFVVPLGIILNVIVVPLAIVCLPFVLLFLLGMYCHERIKLNQRTREGLRAHRQQV